MRVQKILKLENQNKELQEQKETLEIKLQEKTEEMKGTITKGVYSKELQWGKVRLSAKLNHFRFNKSNINAEIVVN